MIQVDTNAQDLEEANRKLRSQTQADRETMAALTTSLDAAESRAESLEKQLNALRNESREKEENADKEIAKQVWICDDCYLYMLKFMRSDTKFLSTHGSPELA